MQPARAENINNIFFDGYYKEIWRSLIPEGLTAAEVDFLLDQANLKPGSKVLDLMCGYGRHALALGRKGIQVTAIDNLSEYVKEITEIAEREMLPVTCIQADVIEYEPAEAFDLAICLGNNLSFFDKKDTGKFFFTIASHLRKGGLFIANSWTIAEIVFKSFTPKTWSEINGLKYLAESKISFHPTRMETEMTIILADRSEEKKKAVDYIYSLNEFAVALEDAGFSVRDMWSIPGKKKFSFGEPRIYIVAEKI
jgi:SAM-dependent methyltransferase